MAGAIPVELGAIEETLLIPLYGRAVETRRARGLLRDPKAVEIVERLDYDFAKWRGARSLVGACIRTRMFDRYVERFLSTFPAGTVVEIGCGMNTRFERVDNGRVRWFDIDLPDVIDLRRRFFEDTHRRTMVATSVLDLDWMDRVANPGGPWFFVAEAVLIYLEGHDARRALGQIADRFPGASIAFDTTDRAMIAGQARHDAMRHLSPDSWFRWPCDDPRQIESWHSGLHLDRSQTLLDADDDIVDRLPWWTRVIVRRWPALLRRKVGGYRMNVFRVSSL